MATIGAEAPPTWLTLRRVIAGPYRNPSTKYLSAYWNEARWRAARRPDSIAFRDAVTALLRHPPLPYERLIASRAADRLTDSPNRGGGSTMSDRPQHDPESAAAGGMSRRTFAGLLGAGVVAAVAPDWAPANAATERPFEALADDRRKKARQPNLLVILADDLGWADLSAYGSPDDPHARTSTRSRPPGIRFTQRYSASAVCSPTRFGLYTGRYPGRLAGGLREPIGAPTPHRRHPARPPDARDAAQGAGLRHRPARQVALRLPAVVQPDRVSAGTSSSATSPAASTTSRRSTTNGTLRPLRGRGRVQDLRYYTGILTERAVEFLEPRHRSPWLLNLNFTTPHWPWEGPGDKAVSDELTARIKAGQPSALFHRDGGSLETYQEMVEDLDRSVGQVLDALKRVGQLDDTSSSSRATTAASASRTTGRSPAARATSRRAASGSRRS